MPEILFQLTEDGSHTLYVPSMDEHYHSVHGAIQESRHVYLGAGFDACTATAPAIFEVGFGTGLNALLTAVEARKTGRPVHYTSVELFPLSGEQVSLLNYGQQLDEEALFKKIHEVPWGEWCPVHDFFELKKVAADFLLLPLPRNEYDVVYFDAFAPNKQADLWQPGVFAKLFHSMKDGGVLVTYCAKGMVRRMLQEVGFAVERLPGPPGKHEILRAGKSFC